MFRTFGKVFVVTACLCLAGSAFGMNSTDGPEPVQLAQSGFGDALGGILGIISGQDPDAQLTEVEPNNTPDQATPLALGQSATGLFHAQDSLDGDYYRLSVSGPGRVTVTVSGIPQDCRITVGALGFQRDGRAPVKPESSVTSTRGESSVTFAFSSSGAYEGFVFVKGLVADGGTISGYNWSATQCVTGGDYYLQTRPKTAPLDVPKYKNNRPIRQAVRYQLRVSFEGTEQVKAPPVDWVNFIRSGEAFRVVFDAATFNDTGWMGSEDPMGVLKAGETYTVKYNESLGWTVTGLDEKTGKTTTETYKVGTPQNRELNLWGRLYRFTGNGEVFDPDHGLVGHLVTGAEQYHKAELEQAFGRATGPEITDVLTYKLTTTFAPEDNPINISLRFRGVQQGAVLKAVWYFLETQSPYKIGESARTLATATEGTAEFNYELAPGKKWPKGKYRVDLYIDEAKIQEVTFTVK